MTAQDSSPYKSLNTTIRLFKITRDKQTRNLNLTLQPFSLECPTFPIFYAISYVWGDDKDRTPVILNEQPFTVVKNIFPFLETIADPPKHLSDLRDQWWWLDSICINQDDFEERGLQVKLMGQIYKKARRVPIWLGEKSEDSNAAIDFLKILREWRRDLNYSNDNALYQQFTSQKYSMEWRAVQNLLGRPWWQRVWTVQELIIPAQDPDDPRLDFYCGSTKMRGKHFTTALWVVYACRRGKLITNEVFQFAWSRRRLTQWFKPSDAPVQSKKLEHKSLTALAAYIGDCKATNPRDRIYSLLGLATDYRMIDEVNYKSSVNDVYTNFVRSFIDTHQSLDIICMAHLYNHHAVESSDEPRLPSWVPDWRAKVASMVIPVMASQGSRNHIGNFRPLDYLDSSADYSAAGNKKLTSKISEDGKSLTCECIIIDYLDGLGGLAGPGSRYPIVQSTAPKNCSGAANEKELSTLLQTISRSLVLDREDRYLNHYAPKDGFVPEFQAFGAAAMQDTYSVHHLFQSWYEENKSLLLSGYNLETILKSVPSPALARSINFKDISGSAFILRWDDTVITMARRLAITEGGILCMTPGRARKGDAVCVLYGCNIPVILRVDAARNSCEFVGECYVDGFMEGQAVKDVENQKRETIPVTIV